MSFWDNVKKFAQPYADDEYDDYDEPEEIFSRDAGTRSDRQTPPASAADTNFSAASPAADNHSFGGKVLNISSNKPGVVLFRPISFGDAVKAADDLRERRAVIVNLENVDKTVARRVIDFLTGCSYALDGKVKKIAGGTYLFCPANMNISGDMDNLQTEVESYL